MANFADPEDPNAIVWNRYIRHLETAGRSPRTIQGYTEACQLLADHTKGDLLALTRENIQSFVAEQKRLHSHGTVLNRFRSIRAFYSWAVREEWRPDSPMTGMKTSKGPVKGPDTPETAYIRALVATCDPKTFDGIRTWHCSA